MLGILVSFDQVGVVLRHDTAHAPSARLRDTRATRKVGLLYARNGHNGRAPQWVNAAFLTLEHLKIVQS